MSDQDLRERLYAAYKHRAVLYYLIYDELRSEVGADRAAEILKRAIRRRGEQTGRKYAEYGPDDFDGLRDAFLKNMPDEGRMFSPDVTRCDAEGLDIVLTTCPLKDAWQEEGLSDDEVATMCDIAAAIDHGTFTGAGFTFSADTWKSEHRGCCHLHIRAGEKT